MLLGPKNIFGHYLTPSFLWKEIRMIKRIRIMTKPVGEVSWRCGQSMASLLNGVGGEA